MRLIVLESNPQFLSQLKASFSQAFPRGEIHYFTDSAAAWECLEKKGLVFDLILISREVTPQIGGLKFLEKLRGHLTLAHAPVLLLSSEWDKAEFARHQKTPMGANAYWNKKRPLNDLMIQVKAMVGFELVAPATSEVQLLESSSIVQITSEAPIQETAGITLDLSQDLPQAALPVEELKIEPMQVEPPATSTPIVDEELISVEEAAKDLPYLFTSNQQQMVTAINIMAPKRVESPVVVDHQLSQDVEMLKKYLMMREQDVSVLSTQLSYAKQELQKSEENIRRLQSLNEELFLQNEEYKRKQESQANEWSYASKTKDSEVEALREELKLKNERLQWLEERLQESAHQYEKLKERVRLDIRKIRMREKELENKLEILKKDSETLITSREGKILELKRKIDLIEFNYDTLMDKNEQEKEKVRKANEKMEHILKMLKMAQGVIRVEEHLESTPTVESTGTLEKTRTGSVKIAS